MKSGKTLEEDLRAKHGDKRVKFYNCDITTAELNEAFNDVLKNFEYIDVVINNAGILNDSPKAYEKQVAVNVVSKKTFFSDANEVKLILKDIKFL